MPRETDAAILDSARVNRSRLNLALERGSTPGRSRPIGPRALASLVVAALVCAGCVGWSYISTHLDSLRLNGSSSVPGPIPVEPSQAPPTVLEEPDPDETPMAEDSFEGQP